MNVHIKQLLHLIKESNGTPFYLRFFKDRMDIQVSTVNVMKFTRSTEGSVTDFEVEDDKCKIFPIMDAGALKRPLEFFSRNQEFIKVEPEYFKEFTEDGHQAIAHLGLIGPHYQNKVNGASIGAMFYRPDNKVEMYLSEDQNNMVVVKMNKDTMAELKFALSAKMKSNYFLFTINENGIQCGPTEKEASKWEYACECDVEFEDGNSAPISFNVPTDIVKHFEEQDSTFYFKKSGATWLAIRMETCECVCPTQIPEN